MRGRDPPCSPPRSPLRGACACSRDGVRVPDRVAGPRRGCMRAGVCWAAGVLSACVHTAWWRSPGSCSWEHMLSLLAGCSVPGSSPGRGGGSRKTGEQHCVCRAGGYPGKPPCQGAGATPPPTSRSCLAAQCAGHKGATGGELTSAEEPLALQGPPRGPPGQWQTTERRPFGRTASPRRDA